MAGIDIKLLRAFVTLTDKGSYQKAAESLFLTQPALSKQINKLEELTGGILFLRGRHGATPTHAGLLLYPKAIDLLNSYAEFMSLTQAIHQANTDKLMLGFGLSTFQNAPVWINIFRKKFPECDVNIRQISSTVQVKMLEEGTLHAGFLRLPVPDSLAYRVLHDEKLMLALPSCIDDGQENIPQILSSYPLLQIEPAMSPCLAEQTAHFLKTNHLSASPVSATEDIPSLLALIAGENGVAFLPASISNILPAGVRLISPGVSQTCWRIGVAWDPKIANRLRDDFLQIIHDNEMLA